MRTRRTATLAILLASLAAPATYAVEPSPGAPTAPGVARGMTGDEATAALWKALRSVEGVRALEKRIEANGGRSIVEPESEAKAGERLPRWRFYVGEERPTHRVRIWTLLLDSATGTIRAEDPATLEEQSFEEWRATVDRTER